MADGIVITPSQQSPGGRRLQITTRPTVARPTPNQINPRWVQDRANELLRGKNVNVKRIPFDAAIKAPTTHEDDYILPIRQRPSKMSSTWKRSAPPV